MATYSNLFIDQGSDFSFNVDLSGVDLDNHTAEVRFENHIHQQLPRILSLLLTQTMIH